jgi:carbonic anhydrase
VNRISIVVLGCLTALGGAGCEQWKAPSRIRELENRVNELSAEVSAIAGKPVGTGKDKDKDKAGEHGEDDKADKKAKDEHGDDKADTKQAANKPKADEHADADEHGEDEHAEEPAEKPKKKPAKPAKPVHWAYSGEEGPSHWGELSPEFAACGTGEHQSPIDLELKATKASPIDFHYEPTAATVIDNGHTIQVNLAPGSAIDIDGASYQLVQFHVHTPSEHLIAGDRFPLEVHLVHKNAEGQLAVVGVLYDLGPGDKALATVWDNWPKKVGVETAIKKPFDPNLLLPEVRTVARYDGSLTTPPCTEGVIWNVMRRTKSISKLALDILRLHYPDNARPVMPLGGRELL